MISGFIKATGARVLHTSAAMNGSRYTEMINKIRIGGPDITKDNLSTILDTINNEGLKKGMALPSVTIGDEFYDEIESGGEISLKPVDNEVAELIFLVKGLIRGCEDLSGLNLSGMDVSGIDFSNKKMVNTNLEGANATGAIFFNADMYQAKLKGANLNDSNLNYAFLHSADLTNATLINTQMELTSLENATLIGTIIKPSQAGTIDYSGAILSDRVISSLEFEVESENQSPEDVAVEILNSSSPLTVLNQDALHDAFGINVKTEDQFMRLYFDRPEVSQNSIDWHHNSHSEKLKAHDLPDIYSKIDAKKFWSRLDEEKC